MATLISLSILFFLFFYLCTVYILLEQLFCSANIDLSAVILLDHTLVHFEIPANNLEKMKKFYRDLFG